MTKTVDPEMARKLREKLENELIPKLQNQKIRTRRPMPPMPITS